MIGVTDRPRAPSAYLPRLANLGWEGVAQLMRPASHSRRAQAARAWAKATLTFFVVAAVVIVVLMIWLDAREITWMPPRGTAFLWPVRILTDFGKFAYVTLALFLAMMMIFLLAPRVIGVAHATLIGLAARLQYMLLAVLVSNAVGELMKGTVGRGRPFVGGDGSAFHFSHFAWSETYASFPSGHATTSCAVAFAVAALWPRWRFVMLGYATAILISRLVLLAHHPSDVIAGALVGVTGAMVVRYWFAARSVVFRIRADGSIVARHSASAMAIARAFRTALVPGMSR